MTTRRSFFSFLAVAPVAVPAAIIAVRDTPTPGGVRDLLTNSPHRSIDVIRDLTFRARTEGEALSATEMDRWHSLYKAAVKNHQSVAEAYWRAVRRFNSALDRSAA